MFRCCYIWSFCLGGLVFFCVEQVEVYVVDVFQDMFLGVVSLLEYVMWLFVYIVVIVMVVFVVVFECYGGVVVVF